LAVKKSVFKRALAHTRTHHPPLQMSGTQRYPGRSRKPPPELKGQVHPDDVQFGSDTDNSTDDETPISEMRRHNDVRAAKVANMPVVVEGKSSKPSSATAKAPKRIDTARIDTLGGDINSVEAQLKLIPFFNDNEVAALMMQLPAYRALAISEVLTNSVDREVWWESKKHTAGVDRWFAGATMVMICQPSSASAERIFSMLKALIGDQQQANALQDYQEASIMARYNGLQRGEL